MNYIVDDINNYSDNDFFEMYNAFPIIIKNKIDRKALIDNKKQSTLGYYLLKKLIKNIFNIDNLPEIAFNENGKPYFKDLNIFFSISHSEELVTCAISNKNIGIDIEKIKQKNKKLYDFVCNDLELADLRNSEDELENFITIWTKKESFIKFLGKGINCNLKNVLLESKKDSFKISLIKNNKGESFILSIYSE